MDGKRRIWGMIFLTSGILGLLALGLMTLTRVSALPLAAVSWPLTVYAGYRMWKAAHPAGNVWRELARRAVTVATSIASAAAVLLFVSVPQIGLGIVAIWIATMLVILGLVALAGRTKR
ncbi:MAG: hypothetical protein ACXW4L_07360 [Candidatus Limnocylindrales bacterium]